MNGQGVFEDGAEFMEFLFEKMLFLRWGLAFDGAGWKLNEDGILTDLSDLIPWNTDIASLGEAEESAVPGNENSGDLSLAKVKLIVDYMPHFPCIAYVYNDFSRKSVSIASHILSCIKKAVISPEKCGSLIAYSKSVKNMTKEKNSIKSRSAGFIQLTKIYVEILY